MSNDPALSWTELPRLTRDPLRAPSWLERRRWRQHRHRAPSSQPFEWQYMDAWDERAKAWDADQASLVFNRLWKTLGDAWLRPPRTAQREAASLSDLAHVLAQTDPLSPPSDRAPPHRLGQLLLGLHRAWQAGADLDRPYDQTIDATPQAPLTAVLEHAMRGPLKDPTPHRWHGCLYLAQWLACRGAQPYHAQERNAWNAFALGESRLFQTCSRGLRGTPWEPQRVVNLMHVLERATECRHPWPSPADQQAVWEEGLKQLVAQGTIVPTPALEQQVWLNAQSPLVAHLCEALLWRAANVRLSTGRNPMHQAFSKAWLPLNTATGLMRGGPALMQQPDDQGVWPVFRVWLTLGHADEASHRSIEWMVQQPWWDDAVRAKSPQGPGFLEYGATVMKHLKTPLTVAQQECVFSLLLSLPRDLWLRPMGAIGAAFEGAGLGETWERCLSENTAEHLAELLAPATPARRPRM